MGYIRDIPDWEQHTLPRGPTPPAIMNSLFAVAALALLAVATAASVGVSPASTSVIHESQVYPYHAVVPQVKSAVPVASQYVSPYTYSAVYPAQAYSGVYPAQAYSGVYPAVQHSVYPYQYPAYSYSYPVVTKV